MSASVTKASVPLVLFEDAEQPDGSTKRVSITLQYSPLSDRAIDEMSEFVRTKFLRTVRQGLEGATAAQYETEMRIAHEVAATLHAFSKLGSKLISTPDGIAYMAWLAVRSNHPDVTIERLNYLLKNPANIAEASALFRYQNISKPVAESKKPEQEKADAKKKKEFFDNQKSKPTANLPKRTAGRLKKSRK